MTMMTRPLLVALVAAGLSQTLTPLAYAQATGMPATGTAPSDQHDAHHAADTTTLPPAAPVIPLPPVAITVTPGTAPMAQMKGGQMDGNMMPFGQMDMPQIMQMMQMMQMMKSGMAPGLPMETSAGGSMMQLGMWHHINGLIAFYKAELQITEAQLPQWNALATVLQNESKKLQSLQGTMMAMMNRQQAGPDQIKARIVQLNAQLDHLKTVDEAVLPLYAVLSDRQKKIADDLITESLMSASGRRM